jgi:outer membrane immunogenic protein
MYNWGGIYIGINGGYGFGNSTWSDPNNQALATTGSFSTTGFVVGGTVGANYQVNQVVFGVEADMDYAGLSGTSTSAFCSGALGAAVSAGLTAGNCQTKDSWLGTARGRLGFAWDRVLLYGTGGGAFGDVKAGLTTGTSFDSSTKFGWTGGAGVEFAITENVTAKIEYLYVALGNGSCSTVANCGADAGAVAPTDAVKFNASLVRAGINFKFGGF